MTTAFHPQANGLVERFCQQLKASLRSLLCGVDWLTHLPWVMLGLRISPKEDVALSSAELVFGSPLVIPGQFLEDKEIPATTLVDMVQQAALPSGFPTRPLPAGTKTASIPKGLLEATFVYLWRDGNWPPLAQCTRGHSQSWPGARRFSAKIGTREVSVSIDCLKPHLGTALIQPTVPASRGRPPGIAAKPETQPPPASADPGEDDWTLVVSRRHKKK